MDGDLIHAVVSRNGVGDLLVVLVHASAQEWLGTPRGGCAATDAVLYEYQVAPKVDPDALNFSIPFFGKAADAAQPFARAALLATYTEATATRHYGLLHFLSEAPHFCIVFAYGEAGEFWGFHVFS